MLIRPNVSPKQLSIATAAALIATPIITFYFILFTHLVNLPMNDDYNALLNFSNHLTDLRSPAAKLHYLLIAQHNEYKLFLEHALFWLQLALSGHIDLTLLCILGDGFVLGLGILLWKMFLPRHEDLATRLALFIPVPWLLFQLQYAQTLNFAMGALQNLPVLLFSLATIYLLLQTTALAVGAAVACLVLAISSSGNGLLMIPVGAIILASNRHYRRALVWAATSIVCLVAYFYAYDSRLWLSPAANFRPYYVIFFLGSAWGYPVKAASFFLGIAICVCYAHLGLRGYFRKRPAVGYSALFLFLTSIGVAGIRSNFGIIHSLSSRYTIYSILLLIFLWFAIAEEWLASKRGPLRQNPVFVSATISAVLFSAAMDVWGLRFLIRRNRDVTTGISLYQHQSGPVFPPPKSKEEQAFNLWARDVLNRSKELGIYQPR